MELTSNEQKVIRKVVRYFNSLEEMAAYLGIDVDQLAGRIKNQNIHLTLEKKTSFNNSRAEVFKRTQNLSSPLLNYTIQ
jgi:hypothetical protein